MLEGDRNWEPTTAVPTSWFHLVVRFLGSDGGVEIYIDGELKETYYKPRLWDNPNLFPMNSGKLVFGRYNTNHGDYSSAVIDEFIVYDRILSPEEIADLYMAYIV